MQLTIRNSRVVAFVGVLVALSLAVQLSPRPPNVEFTSLLAFVVGFVFGGYVGVLFGGFVMFVNGFFSPWGFAGLNLPFQIVGMIVIGLAGDFYRRYSKNFGLVKFYEVAVLGAFLTVLYDIITNVGVAFSYMVVGTPPFLAIVTAFAYGAPFSIIHVASNFVVFGIVFVPLIGALNRTLAVEKSWLKKEF